ncbi:hypothetical protein ACOMHN_011676 [Nucella lapillus]
MDDTLYDNVLNYLKNGTYALTAKGENRDVTKVKKRQLRKTAAKYTIREGVLYRDGILVAKRSQVPEILQEFHDNYVSGGHLGMNKTYKKPQRLMTDFEMGVIAAIRISFPMADVRGCFFHFAQAVWRKVQALGLSGAYRESLEVKTFVRRLAVLPLVPLNEIENVWMDLHGMAPVEVPGIAELCDYMVITWVDDMQATFRRELWNHFQTLQEEVHPNIFFFVSGLKKRQDETETTVASLDAGNAPPPQKRQRKNKDRIRRVLQQYQAGQRPVRSYMDAMCMTVIA